MDQIKIKLTGNETQEQVKQFITFKLQTNAICQEMAGMIEKYMVPGLNYAIMRWNDDIEMAANYKKIMGL